MRSITFAIYICVFFLFSACIKHDVELSINAMLTNRSEKGKKWYVHRVFINDEEVNDCLQDDIWVFKESEDKRVRGGILEVEPDFIKCNLEDQDREYEYLFGINNDRLLYFVDPLSNITLLHEILEIDNENLILEYTEDDGYGAKLRVIRYEFHHR